MNLASWFASLSNMSYGVASGTGDAASVGEAGFPGNTGFCGRIIDLQHQLADKWQIWRLHVRDDKRGTRHHDGKPRTLAALGRDGRPITEKRRERNEETQPGNVL